MQRSWIPLALLISTSVLGAAPAVFCQVIADKPLAVGTVAPDFAANTLEGTPLKLSDWRSQVVVLNFFMPSYTGMSEHLRKLEALATKYAEGGLKTLSISLQPGDTGPGITQAFINYQDIAHPVVADPGQAIARVYGITVPLPALFVIGRDGKIAFYQESPAPGDYAKLEQATADALGCPVQPTTASTEETTEAGTQETTVETAEGTSDQEPVCKCFKH